MTETAVSKIDTVEKLYQEYSHMVRRFDEKICGIYFGRNSPVKITDLFGWSSLLILRKITDKGRWKRIITANGKEIIVHRYSLIPVYDTLKYQNGFHGEVKYPYVLKNPDKLLPSDTLRLRDINNEFSTVTVEDIDDTDDYRFEIVTKSRFCNVNDVQILAADNVNIDEIGEWEANIQSSLIIYGDI